MEEDKLNNAINSLKKSISIYDANYCLATSQALRTVLNELERLQKENEKLKDKFILEKVAKEEIEELLANSILKSVIQDKIEELNKEECDIRYDRYDIQEILKELLGEN